MCSLMDYKPKQNEHKQDQDYAEDKLLEESTLTQTDEDDVIREYTNGKGV
jgi:hypothetical protein